MTAARALRPRVGRPRPTQGQTLDVHRGVTWTRPLFLFRPLNPAFPDSGKNREEKAEGSEAPPDKYCGPAPPIDLTSAPRQDGGARALPRRLPPGDEAKGRLRAASEVKQGRECCGAAAPVRWGALHLVPGRRPGDRTSPGSQPGGPGTLATWEGEELTRGGGPCGLGVGGHVGGVPPWAREAAPLE